MRAAAMVVTHVRCQDATQVHGVENDHVIQTLATNGPDQSLDERVLPGTCGAGHDLSDRHSGEASTECVAVDAVSIPQQPAGRRVLRKGVDDLLRGPFSGRMLGHIEVNHASAFVRQHEEHKQDPSGHCRNGEEVDRHGRCHMIREECAPRL